MTPLRLRSKRNRVELVSLPDGTPAVLKDFGDNREGFDTEVAMVGVLARAGLRVAGILNLQGRLVTYEYLEGTPGADVLDSLEAFPEDPALWAGFEGVCQWLAAFYPAAQAAFGVPMILGDIHLRNFLLGKEVSGVDFECCCPGAPETDIARLAVFAATYDPAGTPVKLALARFFLERCSRELSLHPALLARELSQELAALEQRRGRKMDPAILENLLAAPPFSPK